MEQKRERLSPPQEIFCQQIALGKSQYEAYLAAYPKSRGWKRSSVDAKASHLAALDKIKARKNELLKAAEIEIAKTIAWDRKKAEETLIWLIEKAKASVGKKLSMPAVSAILGAVKELNTMCDIYSEAPEQEDLSGIRRDIYGE